MSFRISVVPGYNSTVHEVLFLIAKYLFLVVGLAALIYWLRVPSGDKKRLVVFGLIAGIVAFGLVKLGAALYYDPRPFISHHLTPLFPHGADNGFPSDHTVLTAFIAVTMYSSSKKLGLALLVLSLLIGIARVVGHIHSPIDIIGSLVFAAIGGLAAFWLTPIVLHRFNQYKSKS